MMEESSLLKVFDGNRLVGLIDGADSAAKKPLDLFEKEILRIFDEFQQLQAQLSAYRWRKVEEELPKIFDVPHSHSADVLIYPIYGCVVIGWFEKDMGWRYGEGTIEKFPTHWMPITLPEGE